MEGKTSRRKRPSKDGLYLRGTTWWANIRGDRISTGCKDRTAARIARARLEREAADPAYDAARRTTIADLIADVLEDRAHAKGKLGLVVTEETLEIYRTKLGHVARVLGASLPLFELDYDAVGRYISQREKEPGNGDARVGQHTIHKELKALRFGLRLEKEKGRYPHDVDQVTRLRRFAEGYKPRKRHLSWEEIPKLIGAVLQGQAGRVSPEHLARAKALRAKGVPVQKIADELEVSFATAKRYVEMNPKPRARDELRARHVAWIISTGGRRKESYRAEKGDHDVDRWVVRLRGTKTGAAERTIPIAPPFRALLTFALRDAPSSGPMFPRWGNVIRSLKLACARAGLERVSPNDLRRTHSSLLKQAGVALDDLAPVMGHKGTHMLERVYARTDLDSLSRALERVDVGVMALPEARTILSRPAKRKANK